MNPASTSHATLQSLLRHARQRLEAAEVDAPRLSAEIILCHALSLRRIDIMLTPDRIVEEADCILFSELVARRATGEPLAYIVGEKEFFGRDFAVNPSTLIPRPETEHLIETALESLRSGPARFVDAGTGSGCIAVTLCAERADLYGLALDMSAPALATASHNARRHGVAQRLAFVRGDFTTSLLRSGSLDLYASNPPYISEAEYTGLSREVRDFEPRSALVPGDTGLEHAAAIIAEATRVLRPHGILLMEFGCMQGADMASLFTPYSTLWEMVEVRRDLAGLDRFIFARRNLLQP